MHRLTPLLAVLLLTFCGCAGYGAEIREFQVRNHAADDIFQKIVSYASSRGLIQDPKQTDLSRRLFVSRWRGGGAPIMGRDGGRRDRLHAEVVRDRSRAGWMILYYFERQRIGEIGRGLQPKDDDWEAAGQNGSKEQQFRYAMNLSLHGVGFGLGVEKEPRNGR